MPVDVAGFRSALPHDGLRPNRFQVTYDDGTPDFLTAHVYIDFERGYLYVSRYVDENPDFSFLGARNIRVELLSKFEDREDPVCLEYRLLVDKGRETALSLDWANNESILIGNYQFDLHEFERVVHV